MKYAGQDTRKLNMTLIYECDLLTVYTHARRHSETCDLPGKSQEYVQAGVQSAVQ